MVGGRRKSRYPNPHPDEHDVTRINAVYSTTVPGMPIVLIAKRAGGFDVLVMRPIGEHELVARRSDLRAARRKADETLGRVEGEIR